MGAQDFPATLWSQLLALHDPRHPRRAQILEELARRYWRPIYHFIRHLRAVPQEAEDLTQQFFAKLLAQNTLDRLSPARGSMRGFLKTAARNFVANAERTARSERRLFSFDATEASWQASPELTPDEVFDRAWARTVLTDAVHKLKSELEAAGRTREASVFEAYYLGDGGATYGEVAQRFDVSENDVRNDLREARGRLRDILRQSAREYLGPGESLDAELKLILGA